MKSEERDNLKRAVQLLNFEYENMSKALSVLRDVYHVPQGFLHLVIHKVFFRLANSDNFDSSQRDYSIWDQFHHLASDETRRLGIHH